MAVLAKATDSVVPPKTGQIVDQSSANFTFRLTAGVAGSTHHNPQETDGPHGPADALSGC